MKWLLCVGLFATSINAAVGQSTLTPEAKALQQSINAKLGKQSANDPGWRASIAAALHRYCESLLPQVPRNTPQEDQWVDSEFHDVFLAPQDFDFEDSKIFDEQMRRYAEREKRMLNSVEYARQGLRYNFSECSALTKSLIELKQASPAAEALLWVRLSRLFRSEDVIWHLADKVGLVSQTDCLRSRQSFWDSKLSDIQAHDRNGLCPWSYIENSIITGAVIPLLEAAR